MVEGMRREPDSDIGAAMYELVRELYPIPRSLTGEGVRSTLERIGRRIPLEIHEVPSGTTVFDWTIPREWTIRDAYILDPSGRKILNFAESNFQVVGYSTPVHRRLALSELRSHLFTLPEHPDWIPYRTSYYNESWGFCLTERKVRELTEGEYEVVIDSSLEDGSMTYAECIIPGEIRDEVLVSAHICHPSQANDNLSGIAVATFIASWLLEQPRRLSYRILLAPGTIGSLAWLSRNEERLRWIRHGLVLAGVGDSGNPTYKRSRVEHAEIDQVVEQVLRERGRPYEIQPFNPWGYDERQFNAPGFGLSVGLFMRTPHGCYPEYHTSADNLEFVNPASLADSLAALRSIIGILERNRTYRNLSPKGEPQLGRRGLYRPIGGASAQPNQLAMLWILNQSDGSNTLLGIARRSGLVFDQVSDAADALVKAGLLAVSDEVEPH